MHCQYFLKTALDCSVENLKSMERHACMHEGEYGHAMTVEHLELGGLVWQQPDFALLHEGS